MGHTDQSIRAARASDPRPFRRVHARAEDHRDQQLALAALSKLDGVRAQRLALDEEELRLGVRCLAAPIFDHAGRVAAAASLSTLPLDSTREQFDALIPEVRECAREISEAIGRE
ncbi:IclR family transcriptional regulator domain-containing protein [Aliiruegeria sabulilitoris]|uniref:IclR family transcriptional regulator domain-containing protein n=1 Tax=Aliiruegeria sabulilitoris TaxID=1510458 RepID=UPI0022B0E0C7|nr:IclR family transcriptional regulator C-terminal domain-containing protein [Aliiruegeria sabulilitoris]